MLCRFSVDLEDTGVLLEPRSFAVDSVLESLAEEKRVSRGIVAKSSFGVACKQPLGEIALESTAGGIALATIAGGRSQIVVASNFIPRLLHKLWTAKNLSSSTTTLAS